METLDNKVIIYDDACPMCKAYTGGFVRAGWLKERQGFANVRPDLLENIDMDRARHEIPLLDTKTGEVTYGLSALFLIIGEKWPIFKPLFRSGWFRALLYPLYQIITYNRRIIAGSGAPKMGFDCAPDVNLFYRWLYILLATAGAAWLSIVYWNRGNLAGEIYLFSQIAFLGGIFFVPKRLDFIGHWATVWLASALVAGIIPGPVWLKVGLGLGLAAYMWWNRWDKLR